MAGEFKLRVFKGFPLGETVPERECLLEHEFSLPCFPEQEATEMIEKACDGMLDLDAEILNNNVHMRLLRIRDGLIQTPMRLADTLIIDQLDPDTARWVTHPTTNAIFLWYAGTWCVNWRKWSDKANDVFIGEQKMLRGLDAGVAYLKQCCAKEWPEMLGVYFEGLYMQEYMRLNGVISA